MGLDLTGWYQSLDDDREFYRQQAENVGMLGRQAADNWMDKRQEREAQGKAPGMLSWAGRGLFGSKERDVDAPITKSEYLEQYGTPETIEQGDKQVATGNLIAPEGSSYEQFLQKTYGGDWKMPLAESDVATRTIGAKQGLLQKFMDKKKPPTEEPVITNESDKVGTEDIQEKVNNQIGSGSQGYSMSGGGGLSIQEAIDARAKIDADKNTGSTVTETSDPTAKSIDTVIEKDKGPSLLDKVTGGIQKFKDKRETDKTLKALERQYKKQERLDDKTAKREQFQSNVVDPIRSKVAGAKDKAVSLLDRALGKGDLSMPQRQALQISEKANPDSPDYVNNISFELSKQSAPNAMRTVQFLVDEGRLTNEHLEELSMRFPEVMQFLDYSGESVDYGESSTGMYTNKGKPMQWANPGGK
mgnify:FL=1|tara:strand:- start:420 stop:1664 length:1245 start_codon:yes stop_codon:yes gene_type:complete